MKKWIFLLLLYSPFANSEYIIITACGEPVVVAFQDGEEAIIAPVTALADKELRAKFLEAVHAEEGMIIEAETQYPIICPSSS